MTKRKPTKRPKSALARHVSDELKRLKLRREEACVRAGIGIASLNNLLADYRGKIPGELVCDKLDRIFGTTTDRRVWSLALDQRRKAALRAR
jgi:hypothetical protein